MDIKKLQSTVVDALEDIKAQDIRVYDTTHLTSLFDRLAVASGTSNRQTKALAASVRDKVKERGGAIISIEGEDTGEWVLVDLGDMVVHIMQPAIRDYYRLEEIWGDKEVKFGAAKRKSSAKSVADEEAPRKVSRHIAASQTTVDDEDEPKKPARKTMAKTAPKTASKAPVTKTAAKKTSAKKAATPAGKTVKVSTPKSAAKKPAAKKTAAKRAPRSGT
ncbi:MAG: rsfS [Paucimonas sp.]|jgi:ribosome-associated protein|nr:rsfS [Paucimonas sp.]